MRNDESVPSASTTGNGVSVPRDSATYLTLKPARIFQGLLAIISFLVLAGLLSHLLRFRYSLTSWQTLGFIRLFDLDQEANVPTWFSSGLLAISATLLILIAVAKRSRGDPWVRYWALLGAIFLLLSLDEIAGIHEASSRFLHRQFELDGLLTNAWVLFAIPLLLVLLVLYARFLRALPQRSLWLFLLSAAVYLGGVVGAEMFSGLVKDRYGTDDLRFALMTTLEESVEMLGLALFIYTLTDYAMRQGLSWILLSVDKR